MGLARKISKRINGFKTPDSRLYTYCLHMSEQADPPCNSHDLYRSESIAINSYLGFTRDIYIDNTLSTVRLPGRLNT